MDTWPGLYVSQQNNRKKGRKRKAPLPYERITSNYPILDHGSLASAIELKRKDGYEWIFPKTSNGGHLHLVENPKKFFPATRARVPQPPHTTLKTRAEQGARFLRTYYPDIDVPFDLIADELRESENTSRSISSFDPFCGSTLSAVYCYEGHHKRNILVAFPSGPNGSDLNMSPIYFKTDNAQFTPRSSPAWSFQTPILQITSTSPASRPALTRKKENFLAVRTFAGTSIFDLQKQVTYGLAQFPPKLKEVSVIVPSELGCGALVDMAFIPSSVPEMFLVDSKGQLVKYTFRSDRVFSHHLFNGNIENTEDMFWSVKARASAFEGVFSSSKHIQSFDTRMGIATTELYDVQDQTCLVTSIEVTGVDHLLCASTTTEVIWLDDRFSRRPLLASRHHRNFDRTLSVQSFTADHTTISFLDSRRNGYVNAFGVIPLEDGPIQCCMNGNAMPFTGVSGSSSFSRSIIRHAKDDTFSLLELNEQGGIYHLEIAYELNGSGNADESRRPQLVLHWSEEVKELDKKSEKLQPEYGRMSGREQIEIDVSELYEKLFHTDEEENWQNAEENAESVYDLIDNMPLFWRRAETEPTTSRTLFDIAFSSVEDPVPLARADFLSGTPLNSVRGYRALRQGRLNLSSDHMKELRDRAGWHSDLSSTMRKTDPAVFRDHDFAANELRSPYIVHREDEEIPEAIQRETEAAQQLALDLALSKDVMRGAPFISPHPKVAVPEGEEGSLEAAETLSIATEKLSLDNRRSKYHELPPPVTFSSCKPMNQREKGLKIDLKANSGGSTVEENDEDEDEKPVEMPLGVRLLLNEWVVGTDPKDYVYVDPYDLDSQNDEGSQDTGASLTQLSIPQTQSQVPPTIIAAKSLANTQTRQPPSIGPSSQPAARSQPLSRQLPSHASFSQMTIVDSQESQHQVAMANTQILPGPFGGRPSGVPKKKPAKKRIGGF